MRVRRLVVGVALLATVLSQAANASAGDSLDTLLERDLRVGGRQLAAAARTLSPPGYPKTTDPSGSWTVGSAGSWTSGFFPGSLWLMYEQTRDRAWRERARRWQAGLESQKGNTSTHDVGFIIFTSFGNGYRLTGNDAYRRVVLSAARSLATRFSREVGALRSWDGAPSEFTVIIDNVMNLELLFWASSHGGNREWRDMAVSHALRTREDHVRPDGSTYQVIDYDPATGALKRRATKQGLSAESTWSRGQAWAVYGFATAFRETTDLRFLTTARRTADYFIDHLPSDMIPYWDFEAPGIPGEPRDSSAAAVAASGLLELSRLEPDAAHRRRYLTAAEDILRSLSSRRYLSDGTESDAILLHATQSRPKGKYDTGAIWGDYYFLEALARYDSARRDR